MLRCPNHCLLSLVSLKKLRNLANFKLFSAINSTKKLVSNNAHFMQLSVESTSEPMQQICRPLLCPPPSVRGMKVLDRSAFAIRVDIPTIYVPANRLVADVVSRLKRYDLLLKYKVNTGRKRRMRDVPDSHSNSCNSLPDGTSEGNKDCESESLVPIVLNPEKLQQGFDSLPAEVVEFLAKLDVSASCNFRIVTASIDYGLWSKEDIFRAVLPEGEPTVSGYSIVGHIVHVNLKESLYPFKNLIGQVLLDKVPQAKTVINKSKIIETAYRNFEIELLAGEANFKTRVKENGCIFDLDYSQVYWNSRLCTEHKRVVDLVKTDDVIIDGFAGIGPFAVLAARTFAAPILAANNKQQRQLFRAKQQKKMQELQDQEHTGAADQEQLPQEMITAKTAPIRVVANDLNPQACYWLRHNLVLNKVPDAMAEVHSLDAGQFIQTIVKSELVQFLSSSPRSRKAHIIMNLPATAVSFLPCFLGLLSDCSLNELQLFNGDLSTSSANLASGDGTINSSDKNCEYSTGNGSRRSSSNSSRSGVSIPISSNGNADDAALTSTPLPIFVYVYTFSRSEDPVNDAFRQVCDALCLPFPPNPSLMSGHDVRNVAPNKQMICVTVQLTQRTLFEVRQRPPSSHRSSPE